MIMVGVYGGIASGKSVLMDAMAQHGFYCLDCDRILFWLAAHAESENGFGMKAAIQERFGSLYNGNALVPQKMIDRLKDDRNASRSMMEISKQYTYREVVRRIKEYQENGGTLLATDAVQILWDCCEWVTDCSVRVAAPTIYRILWARMRTGESLRDAERRVLLTDEKYRSAMDREFHYTLYNDKTLSEFREACDSFLRERENFGWQTSSTGKGDKSCPV